MHDTHTRVNDVLRERVRVIRERNARAAETKEAGMDEGTDVIEASFDHLVKENADDVSSADPENREGTGEEVTYGGWLAAPPAGTHASSEHVPTGTAVHSGEPEEPERPSVPLPAGIVRVGLPAGQAETASGEPAKEHHGKPGDPTSAERQR